MEKKHEKKIFLKAPRAFSLTGCDLGLKFGACVVLMGPIDTPNESFQLSSDREIEFFKLGTRISNHFSNHFLDMFFQKFYLTIG